MEPTPGRPLRVATWNVAERVDKVEIARTLRIDPALGSADVVLLQQIDWASTVLLAASIGFDHVFTSATAPTGPNGAVGHAILARRQLSPRQGLELTGVDPCAEDTPSSTHASMSLDGTDVSLYNVNLVTPHACASERVRAAEPRIVASRDRRITGPAIIGGDFDVRTRGGARRLDEGMRRAGLRRASRWTAPIVFEPEPARVLDHFFVRAFTPVAAATARRAASGRHQPMWVDFELTAEESSRPRWS